MKLTKSKLKTLIEKEARAVLKEGEEDEPYDAYKHMKLWDCFKYSDCDGYYREVDKEGCKRRCHDDVYNKPESYTEPPSSSKKTSSGRKSDFDKWQSGEKESYRYMQRMEESGAKFTKEELNKIVREELETVLNEYETWDEEDDGTGVPRITGTRWTPEGEEDPWNPYVHMTAEEEKEARKKKELERRRQQYFADQEYERRRRPPREKSDWEKAQSAERDRQHRSRTYEGKKK